MIIQASFVNDVFNEFALHYHTCKQIQFMFDSQFVDIVAEKYIKIKSNMKKKNETAKVKVGRVTVEKLLLFLEVIKIQSKTIKIYKKQYKTLKQHYSKRTLNSEIKLISGRVRSELNFVSVRLQKWLVNVSRKIDAGLNTNLLFSPHHGPLKKAVIVSVEEAFHIDSVPPVSHFHLTFRYHFQVVACGVVRRELRLFEGFKF